MESQTVGVVREAEAARILAVSVAALRRWRREGRGPTFVRMERCIGYRLCDLESFLNENLCSSGKAASARRGSR
jgi:predicted site-specific integrase-resolvase